MRTATAIVVTLGAIAALAQQPAQPPETPQPTFRTEVNYVRVDAYPTRNGQAVADLTRDDFEIIEDKQPQKIEQFERVQVRAAGPQDTRIEPNTVAESRSMAESSRARVFVVFLDTYHVGVAGSHDIRRPLVTALDRLIGQDDLVAVMTPEMSGKDITFARKTTTIEGMLTRYWHWGERDRLNPPDPRDEEYLACYPGRGPVKCPDGTSDNDNGVADEMIARQHEHTTVNALHDLVGYLRGVREERKAVLVISDGWLQYRPNPSLARKLYCQIPSIHPGVIPGTGRLSGRSPSNPATGSSPDRCEAERQVLAQIDDQQLFRDLTDEANRANASFYLIDPRGLPVFDTPIDKAAPLNADAAMLRARADSLRQLADNTDGLAMVTSNDLDGSFKKIVADLSAYYLLGYYSSGKLDGRFHSITVRVKRPGVQVRARKGYLSLTADAAARLTRAANPDRAPTPAEAEAIAFDSVLRPLNAFARETSLRFRAVAGWKADGTPQLWVVGEIGTADSWKAGADADITLSQEGATLATAHATVTGGSRAFKVALHPAKPLAPGDYSINVRTSATSRMASSTDMVPLQLPSAPDVVGSVLIRKGPYTGVKEVLTADLRFRRSEQLRVEIPASGSDAPTARLLDRTGKPLTGVPVAAAVRDDPDGSRWFTAQVPLFPLAPADYVVEIAAGSTKTLTPFRIIP